MLYAERRLRCSSTKQKWWRHQRFSSKIPAIAGSKVPGMWRALRAKLERQHQEPSKEVQPQQKEVAKWWQTRGSIVWSSRRAECNPSNQHRTNGGPDQTGMDGCICIRRRRQGTVSLVWHRLWFQQQSGISGKVKGRVKLKAANYFLYSKIVDVHSILRLMIHLH